MTQRLSLGIPALATFLLAIATRLWPLSWSPYPTNLDGFAHARVSQGIVRAGRMSLDGLRADQIVEPLTLAIGASVTGVTPLFLAQPVYSIIGAVTILLGILLVRRLAAELNWPRVRTKAAVTLIGLTLALDGIFIRRTGTPDSDAFTLVLIPVATLGMYIYVGNDRPSWLAITALLLFVLPITHTFSTLITALGVTALVFALALTGADRTRLGIVASVVAVFWVYFLGYYRLAPTLSLSVPYIGRVLAHPGLFVAWLIVMILGILWFQRSSTRWRRLTFLLPLAFFFLVMLVNSWVEVFPGTVRTPQNILAFTLPLFIPVALAAFAAPLLGRTESVAVVLLALLVAPVVEILFSLTAALSPAFFGTVLRAQTFAHLSAAVVAVAGVLMISSSIGNRLDLSGGQSAVTVAMVALLLGPVLWSLPIAYLDLDTGGYPRGTVPSEFEAARFTHRYVDGPWASDHKQTRLVGNYFGSDGTISATVSWLSGGGTPGCTLVSKRSWTTTGAHLFPTAPLTMSPDRFETTLAKRNLIYHSSGRYPVSISRPPRQTGGSC